MIKQPNLNTEFIEILFDSIEGKEDFDTPYSNELIQLIAQTTMIPAEMFLSRDENNIPYEIVPNLKLLFIKFNNELTVHIPNIIISDKALVYLDLHIQNYMETLIKYDKKFIDFEFRMRRFFFWYVLYKITKHTVKFPVIEIQGKNKSVITVSIISKYVTPIKFNPKLIEGIWNVQKTNDGSITGFSVLEAQIANGWGNSIINKLKHQLDSVNL